jgi:hypothetical protein
MKRRPNDPRIDDLLADSLVQAMMRADHVEPDALRSLMDRISRQVISERRGILAKGEDKNLTSSGLNDHYRAECCW